ncbi:hypothetical protein [Alishewanella jeotgali]|uniref:Uncharacterized protein n=1 Tax=Alishewanella jeotgali KCTC 22429 TaxID=1129374 RepID=H3ZGF5_9ALTE|nr:hypothetical protein [Alishewanella jeotgali]EHR40475.1 hypothetical protein AJE_12259 [Alishewanella jeotgali KCTC 22429]
MNVYLFGKLKLITFRPLLLILIALLSGCATNRVFLHTYEIEQEDIDKIVASLKEKKFDVEVSERMPPILTFGSFIIYPRDSGDNEPLVQILDTIGEHGYYTNLIAQNRVKNHYYTKKTNIGLYLINPRAQLLSAQQQLEMQFPVNLTEVTFSSTNCIRLFSLEFAKDHTAMIRQAIPKSNDKWTFQWQQTEDRIIISVDDKTINYTVEKNYKRSGNQSELHLTIFPGNALALGISEPLACKYESTIHLVD